MICRNCLHPFSEHAADADAYDWHCPAGNGGYYNAVFYVPFKSNLEYLERVSRDKKEYETLR